MAKSSTPRAKSSGEKEVCGLVMPIGASPSYEAHHWSEVRVILNRAVEQAGMRPQPVWEGGATDIIHDRIVRNLFENPVVVCDVSGLNPNVMLEVGMRLSFGKAAILITDDIVSVPFDTKMIDHLAYPRDLHLLQTEKFIDELSNKIVQVNAALGTNKYRPFIKNFGSIEGGTIGENLDSTEVILSRLDSIDSEIRRMRRPTPVPPVDFKPTNSLLSGLSDYRFKIVIRIKNLTDIQRASSAVRSVAHYSIVNVNGDLIEILLPGNVLWKSAEGQITETLTMSGIEFTVVSAGIVPASG